MNMRAPDTWLQEPTGTKSKETTLEPASPSADEAELYHSPRHGRGREERLGSNKIELGERHQNVSLHVSVSVGWREASGDGERGMSRTEGRCYWLLNLWTTAPSAGTCSCALILERIPCCFCLSPGGTSDSPQF